MHLSLRGRRYGNNSNILIPDIGEGDCGALSCFTDLIECCRDSDTPTGISVLGQWLYPNGSAVGVMGGREDFYIDRGSSVVRLHRRINVMSPTGNFCCEVPDATSTNMRICINTQAVGKHDCMLSTLRQDVICVLLLIFSFTK